MPPAIAPEGSALAAHPEQAMTACARPQAPADLRSFMVEAKRVSANTVAAGWHGRRRPGHRARRSGSSGPIAISAKAGTHASTGAAPRVTIIRFWCVNANGKARTHDVSVGRSRSAVHDGRAPSFRIGKQRGAVRWCWRWRLAETFWAAAGERIGWLGVPAPGFGPPQRGRPAGRRHLMPRRRFRPTFPSAPEDPRRNSDVVLVGDFLDPADTRRWRPPSSPLALPRIAAAHLVIKIARPGAEEQLSVSAGRTRIRGSRIRPGLPGRESGRPGAPRLSKTTTRRAYIARRDSPDGERLRRLGSTFSFSHHTDHSRGTEALVALHMYLSTRIAGERAAA